MSDTLGYREPTFRKTDLISSLKVLNAALTVERLVKERRNAELNQFLFELMSGGANV